MSLAFLNRETKLLLQSLTWCFTFFAQIQVTVSYIYDLDLFLLFSPTSNSIQQATVELLHFLFFLSTPSSHPFLQPHSLSLLSFYSLPPLEKKFLQDF